MEIKGFILLFEKFTIFQLLGFTLILKPVISNLQVFISIIMPFSI